jgi:outer membrane receptor for ferric coprogen and ferric-rhodotorulic acid
MYYETSYGRITQDSYALVGGYVQYNVNDQVSLSLNLDNITNEKYLSSVRTDQAFYGAPTDYRLTLRWSL